MLRGLAALAAVALAAGQVRAASPDAELEDRVMGTKAPYAAPETAESAPAPCRLIFVSQVQRHGSRHVLSLSKVARVVDVLRQASTSLLQRA